MKVLVNALSAKRGGIYTYTRNLSRILDADGIDLTIAAPERLASLIGKRAMHFDAADYGPIQRLLWEQVSWRRIVRERDPDVLFSSANFALLNSPVPQLLLVREGGLFNPFYLKYVFPRLDPRIRLTTKIRRSLMIRSIRAATKVMFPSESLRDWVARWVPEIAETGIVNRYGIDLSRFSVARPRIVPDRRCVDLLYVSVFYPHKNPCTLSRAVPLLRAAGIGATACITMEEPEFRLWSSGDVEYEELRSAASRGEVTLGAIEYDLLAERYNSASVFMFPSVSETFGFPLVEAMACGLPVIAADTTINREICGPAALYHAPHDPASVARRVTELVERPDLYRWLSAAGRQRVSELFDWRQHFGRTAEILREIAR
jgi:glycosyltransferase involved in cell wall biosynthesis